MWAVWLTEPTGWAKPLRAASTPEMNVVATAPIPGVRTPSLPVAGLTEDESDMRGACHDIGPAGLEGIPRR